MSQSIWQRVRTLATPAHELEAAQLREQSASIGSMAVGQCCTGQVVTVTGNLSSVTLRPKQGLKVLEAELFDGSGTLTLMWLGRRSIAGITPGRSLHATGRVVDVNGHLAMYNPRYTLIAKSEGA